MSPEECLRRIAGKDAEIEAFVHVNQHPEWTQGPLEGVCFGIKDIFDTYDLPTEYGSPLYAGRRPERDAWLVSRLRRLGAVILGKTHTAAFAYFDPPPTRNPRAPGRTPGGSSSGSAAAVAAGMVPYAIGSQTQGSVIRPAAYCGVVGFKPTYGLLPLDGALGFAPSLDTAGFFAATAGEMCALWQKLGYEVAARGTDVVDALYPAGFEQVWPAVRVVNDYEGARTHQELWKQHGSRIGGKLADLVQRGLQIPRDPYEVALETLRDMRAAMQGVYERHAVLRSPAATGPAPMGLGSTGDPSANGAWTGLHGPTITIPIPGRNPPEGWQLTAAPGQDGLLLTTAAAFEAAL